VAIFLTATAAFERKVGRAFLGRYCCGKCSVSLWRHLAAGGMSQPMRREWLAAGMAGLKAGRTGDGRWRSLPFWYALSAVEAIDSPAALAELRYAAPALQRLLKRPAGEDAYARRRRAVAERCLARC
jgi:hypothetical protein